MLPIAIALPSGIAKVKEAIINKVPNFTATIQKGELSITGVPQPFVYSVPEADGNFVVVVDTVSTSTQSLSTYLKSGQSGVLLSRNLLEIYRSDLSESRTQGWMGATDGTITKTDLIKAFNGLTHRSTLFVISLLVFAFLYLGITIGRIVSLFLITLLVYVIAAISKHRTPFGHLFTMGLYATTVPTILAVFLPMMGVGFGSIYGVALLAFMLALVFTKDDSATAPTTTPPTV